MRSLGAWGERRYIETTDTELYMLSMRSELPNIDVLPNLAGVLMDPVEQSTLEVLGVDVTEFSGGSPLREGEVAQARA